MKKEIDRSTIEDVTNLFRLKKGIEAIKDKTIIDIINLFKLDKEEEEYYKPVRVGNFCMNNYIEFEYSGDRNFTIRIEI